MSACCTACSHSPSACPADVRYTTTCLQPALTFAVNVKGAATYLQLLSACPVTAQWQTCPQLTCVCSAINACSPHMPALQLRRVPSLPPAMLGLPHDCVRCSNITSVCSAMMQVTESSFLAWLGGCWNGRVSLQVQERSGDLPSTSSAAGSGPQLLQVTPQSHGIVIKYQLLLCTSAVTRPGSTLNVAVPQLEYKSHPPAVTGALACLPQSSGSFWSRAPTNRKYRLQSSSSTC